MKAKKCFAALALALLLSVSFMLAACGSRPDGTAGSETPAQGGNTAAVYVLSASTAAADDTVTADVDYTVEHAPNVSFDSSNSGYTADSIRTDTFSFSYPADEPLDLYIEKGAVVEVTNGQKYTIGDTSTNTYTVTATAAGTYVFRLKQGDDLAAKLVYTVAEAYPGEPDYNPLSGYGTNNDLSVAYAHDPSVVEADGMYYVFSTDNTGEFGYQVRQSSDMIRWEYVGSAIQGFGTGGDGVEANCLAGTSPLQEVYEIISRDHDWSYWGGGDNEGPNWTLWAPDVVEGADGKYWLYGCWTADFAAGHSIIFLCKADSVTGPYTYDSIILYSYNGWTNGPNAIDPQIYYVGNRMFMAYGSFRGGTWALELDPATGTRLSTDLYSGADWSKTAQAGVSDGENGVIFPAFNQAAMYGTQLVNGAVTEGPTVNYHEGVEIYTGDVADYTASAVTTENRYYMMGSANSLSVDYNMRSFTAVDDGSGNLRFSSLLGDSGNRVSGSFSWKQNKDDPNVSFDFAYPGHNDMITTSAGKNLLVYHDRVTFASGSANHYLLTSLYGFNSRGDLVMNPNRYAGEAERVVTAAEIANLSGGKYSFAYVTDSNYRYTFNGGYAMEGLTLRLDEGENASAGDILFGGETVGRWTLYGDNWVYMNITGSIAAATGTGRLSGEFYGMAFPAYIESEGRGGLSVSLLSADGSNTLYLNMAF